MSSYWCVPPIWTGDTCFILAGGPSLRGFEVRQILGRGHLLVVNDSYLLAPQAEVCYFCDRKWYDRNQSGIAAHFHGRHLVTLENEIPLVRRLRNTGATGLERDPCGLRHGSNSGYQAINLAYHLGARRIVLLGYDMKVAQNGRTHWHGDHPGQNAAGFEATLRVMRGKFPTIAEPLRKEGVEVINATPGSLLDCFLRMDLDEVLHSPLMRM